MIDVLWPTDLSNRDSNRDPRSRSTIAGSCCGQVLTRSQACCGRRRWLHWRVSRAPGFCIWSVVSSVSATGPSEPAHNRTGRLPIPLSTWCDVGSGEAPSGAVCWCDWDGMQEARGSNPLSSTPTETAGQPACGCSFPGWGLRRRLHRSSTSGSKRAATRTLAANGTASSNQRRGLAPGSGALAAGDHGQVE
jgi:hypothetical protein